MTSSTTSSETDDTAPVLEVRALIDRVPNWAGRATSIVTLPGGITNRNYLVTLEDGLRFVVRLNGKNTELLGIDRANELAANRAAAELGLAPPVLHFFEPEQYLVTKFLNAEPVVDLEVDDVLEQVGALLASAHRAPKLKTSFACFTIGSRYARLAIQRDVTLPSQFEHANEIVTQIEKAFSVSPDPMVPAHNDLLNANFLRGSDRRIWLIDWEYAGMNNRWFDLGNLVVNNNISLNGQQRLVHAYTGSITNVDLARVALMTIVSDMREAMWGVVQQGLSTLDFDYAEYANTHFDRLLEHAQRPSFIEDLSLVTNDLP